MDRPRPKKLEKLMTDNSAGQENVLKFRSLLEANPALQADVEQHVGNGSWNATAIVQIGRDHGLEFTANDIETVMDQDDELSDFELELVAAAGGPTQCGNDGL